MKDYLSILFIALFGVLLLYLLTTETRRTEKRVIGVTAHLPHPREAKGSAQVTEGLNDGSNNFSN